MCLISDVNCFKRLRPYRLLLFLVSHDQWNFLLFKSEYAISNGYFHLIRICSIFHTNSVNGKLKAWSLRLRKNHFCILNNGRGRALQSSITFFLYTLYRVTILTI